MSRCYRGHAWSLVILCATLSGAATSSFAHVALSTRDVAAGASYRAVLQVPHGCDGAATTSIRVEIPDGVIAVKPMPKPGWTLTLTQGAYARSYQDRGKPVGEGAKAIEWSGGALADGHYDEFVFVGVVAGELAGRTVYFPTMQRCGAREMPWTGMPGASAPQSPMLRVAAADSDKSTKVGDLTITAPWTRATPGGAKVAGGYLKITNSGAAPDRLLGGTAAIAGRVEVHEMSMSDGVMRMRQLAGGLEIKPGASLELSPGGYHLMMMDLKQGLREGDTVAVTLRFEKAGTVAVTFRVGSIGEGSGAGASEHKH